MRTIDFTPCNHKRCAMHQEYSLEFRHSQWNGYVGSPVCACCTRRIETDFYVTHEVRVGDENDKH
jgi:hypothetical protein